MDFSSLISTSTQRSFVWRSSCPTMVSEKQGTALPSNTNKIQSTENDVSHK